MKNLLKWLACPIFASCYMSCQYGGEIIDFSTNDSTSIYQQFIIDLTKKSQGTYVGKVYTNNILTEDNEIVYLKSIQDSLLSLQADFLEKKYWKNFRIDSIDNRYYLRNEALEGFSIYIETDSLFIDYNNNVQDAISYRGRKIE